MQKELAGTIMFFNPLSQGYSYKEAIKCLQSLTDYTIIVDCGSDDGTVDTLSEFENDKTLIIYRHKTEWDLIQGRTKLAYFTNIAIDKAKELGYEWQLNLQADEAIGLNCYDDIREAIRNNSGGYWTRRINLWGNSHHYLSVTPNRSPVGTEIIRLTKTKYHSIDDAQSIDYQESSWDYLDKIKIYHTGFIRSKYVHTKKIKHMLTEIFLMGNDKAVEEMGEVFDCWKMGFSKEDLKPIEEQLPIFIKDWCEEVDEINNIII